MEGEIGGEDVFSLGKEAACCCFRQAVARGYSRRGGEGDEKAAGAENCDDSVERKGRSCVSVADAFREITSAPTSNSIVCIFRQYFILRPGSQLKCAIKV